MKTGWLCVLAACLTWAQDPQIAAMVDNIRAIDNHAHPSKIVAENETDPDWDDFPMEAYKLTGPDSLPVRMRTDNPELIEAWRALSHSRGSLQAGDRRQE